MKLLAEFKAFILRGSVVDLAVGIIIGAAFTAIVTSLVNDILLPPIAALTGGIDFADKAIDLPGTTKNDKGEDVPVKLRYGKFVQLTINFLITGGCLFFAIKGVNTLMRKKAAAPAPPDPTPTEKLLTEIRDLLQKRG